MTPTLVQRHLPLAAPVPRADLCARARDWAEIQERMLVPLYEAVYERLEVGTGTRVLGLGCGSGLALLMAASRGAVVTGVESGEPERLALARERLLPEAREEREPAKARLTDGSDDSVVAALDALPYDLVTAFQPIGCTAGDSQGLSALLQSASPLAQRGAAVVLVGWGPPERCATSSVLRVATKLADPLRSAGSWRPALRDDLEEVAQRAGLRPDGSGRVACPFGYSDTESALKGLLSTGLFDAAVGATDPTQVDKEVTEALQPYVRKDGTVWMPNVFRYLIARTA
ncbi:SAM-dependent methyltransferase [Streptomyces sp. SID8379]|uniref:class I SAM-dependent methyltransferase n=1 Tax=unclassified Streptomyces TaxID=2593676 RepID=UPI000996E623|nr:MULTISPECIES: SAM-dependent methyltransferase [unclassified Streptomyces]MYW65325.1 SAM-dependent methyltransferase [Streptomyces sp. SID8379]